METNREQLTENADEKLNQPINLSLILPSLSAESKDDSVATEVMQADTPRFARRKRSPVQGSIHVLNMSNDPNKVRLPKIHNEDVRRKYPAMLINVLNGMDIERLAEFFKSFAHSQTILRRQLLSATEPHREVQSFSFYGQHDILLYLHLLNVQGPDRIMQMKGDASIVTRSDTFRTDIIFEFSLHSSYLFLLDNTFIASFLLELNERRQAEYEAEEGGVRACADLLAMVEVGEDNDFNKFMNQMRKCLSETEAIFKQRFPRLIHPGEISFDGKVILSINNIYEQEQIDEIVIQSYGLRRGGKNLE